MRPTLPALCLISILSAAASVSADDFQSRMKPFVQKYCAGCHGPDRKEADLRLDTLSTTLDDIHVAERWNDVLDELNGAAMPPEDARQPGADELSSILELLTFEVGRAKKSLFGKDRTLTMRRLNQREYINTIHDLTGICLHADQVPDDTQTSGFDTNGSALFMSSYQLTKYRELAGNVLTHALSTPEGEPVVKVGEAEEHFNKRKRIFLAKYDPDYAGKRKPTKKKDKKQKKPDDPAEIQRQVDDIKAYLGMDITRTCAILSTHNKLGGTSLEIDTLHKKDVTPGFYRFTLTAGHTNCVPTAAMPIRVVKRKTGVRTTVFDGYVSKPYPEMDTLEFELFLDSDCLLYIEGITPDGEKGNEPYVAVDKLEITGPIQTSAYSRIFTEAQGSQSEDEYILSTLKRFALKAFRGQSPSDKLLTTLVDYYRLNRSSGMPVEQAVVGPLAVVLSSPKFLYRFEQDAETINDAELAVRLSYFLWGTYPDAELIGLANDSQLSDPGVLRAQVKRMLNDRRSIELANGFVPQWLDLHLLKEVDVNNKTFKRYTPYVRNSVAEECVQFFNTIATGNLSIENFIDSDFAVVNMPLQEYYRLPGETVGDFAPVELPPGSHRGGLLGQAAILIMTANGDRTSPVRRGVFIMDKLLGMPSPEPPPNVPQIESNADGLSLKNALRLHQQKPQCSSCHRRIDPIGFGLENFDASGAWRDFIDNSNSEIVDTGQKKNKDKSKDRKKGKDKHGETVDSAGRLPSGETFNGVDELKTLLMTHKDRFSKSFIEALASYAYGREVGFSDAQRVDELHASTKRNGYRLGDLITEIVLTPEFRQK